MNYFRICKLSRNSYNYKNPGPAREPRAERDARPPRGEAVGSGRKSEKCRVRQFCYDRGNNMSIQKSRMMRTQPPIYNIAIATAGHTTHVQHPHQPHQPCPEARLELTARRLLTLFRVRFDSPAYSAHPHPLGRRRSSLSLPAPLSVITRRRGSTRAAGVCTIPG